MPHAAPTRLWPLMLGALGVVYGDIGTSPIYTFRECLAGVMEQQGSFAPRDVIELLSLIFWSLTLVVSIKYLVFILRADNRGEGGIFALLALLPDRLRGAPRAPLTALSVLVIFGAALLYGDGAITPAISVLSAMEGLRVAAPAFPQSAVIACTVVVLVLLFAVQRRGTRLIGIVFGPVMLVWFAVLGGLGIWHIGHEPSVMAAVLPTHAVGFFLHHGPRGFFILGSVVLAVTGGEALYADMGHFGRAPMRRTWWLMVMPALLLSYFGQGALVLRDASAATEPFFLQVPKGGPGSFALVALSSVATVIASQAMISGVFSLTRQAMQLGVFPRVTITHTDADQEGQIYCPELNSLLGIACITLVLVFRESSALAAAYGIAVTGTMSITSVVFYAVLVEHLGWSRGKARLLLAGLLAVDVPFLLANLSKVLHGGAVPILIGLTLTLVMVVWREGRRTLAALYGDAALDFEQAWARLASFLSVRTPGTGIFMASSDVGLPPVLGLLVERMHALHEQVVLLTVQTVGAPKVPLKDRVLVMPMQHGFSRVLLRFGFLETPDVPRALRLAQAHRLLELDLREVTYYLARERVLGEGGGRMGGRLERLFGFLQRNAVNADRYFRIPRGQVIEIGQQIDL